MNWPKTVMTVGTKDPLCDDTLMMMEKMVKSNVDCRCILYEDLSHGYLNTEKMIEASEKPVKDSIEHWKELISSTLDPVKKSDRKSVV